MLTEVSRTGIKHLPFDTIFDGFSKGDFMYLYVELWKARSAWIELSREERESWFDNLLASLQEQLQSGVEPLGFARNDEDTPLAAGYDFIGVWRMPNKDIAVQFEKFVDQAGWHAYFEQVNVRGPILEIEAFSSTHIGMG